MNESEDRSSETDRPAAKEFPARVVEDQFYRALAARDRRRVLSYLLETTRSDVEELATVLCGWEATTTQTMQTPADRRTVLANLYHNHLPRLADAGLIEYDPQTGSVRIESLHPVVVGVIRQSVRGTRPDDVEADQPDEP